MSLFRKKPDPLSDRARALEAEIAALQVQIKQAESGQPLWPGTPRLRSPAMPTGQKTVSSPVPAAPVFEDVDQKRLKASAPFTPPAGPHPELGPRPRDLSSTVQNLKRRFGLTPASNPKLVKLLDSGQIQGLRPLRYERRVARNRFFLLSALLLGVLYGLFKAIVGGR
ncbi:MAG: hypothetical protein HZA92_17655 [Verrucomicrobia bacterium]|nr:hypothetical protein [Verrucomicrobiota bacterium]